MNIDYWLLVISCSVFLIVCSGYGLRDAGYRPLASSPHRVVVLSFLASSQ
jgi:hypothetical protein